MFDKDILVIPDGTYERSEQRFKVDKIEAPNGKKLSPQLLNQHGFLTFVYSNQEYTLKASTKVISQEKRGLGIINPIDINIKVSSEYRAYVEAQICDRVSKLLPTASGYIGSSWLGTVAESRTGGLENAMRDVDFDLIVPKEYYRPPITPQSQIQKTNYVLMARDMRSINDPISERRIAEAYVKSVYDMKKESDRVLKLIYAYFESEIKRRTGTTEIDKMYTKIPILL